ncbi:MAG: SUMF1/EgtB/PvdO family nonheme iron enzyme [Bacteroidota bacterium]
MSDTTDKNLFFEEENASNVPMGKNHLFVVGINDYHKVGKLNNARRDAEALVQLLQERYQFEPERTTTLYDEEASRSAIIGRLRQQLNKLKPEDNLVIFFSGHGHFDTVLEEGYWVPVDADYQAIDTYVSYDFLQKIARAANQARHVLFIVDSCYSGAVLVRGKDSTQSRLEKDPSRWIIASGRNEVVLDGKVGGNSPFAGELLQLLQEHANEGIHTLRLVDRLTENVSWNSDQTPIGQPLHGVGHRGGQFVFHAKRNEKRDWHGTQQSDTIAAYERFLKAWPDGRFADEAAWRIAQKRHSISAYTRYLDRPSGAYRGKALDQLALLEDEKRFQRAKVRGLAALIRFCETYPDSAYLEAARVEIARIREAEREPEAWQKLSATLLPEKAPEEEKRRQAQEEQEKQESESSETTSTEINPPQTPWWERNAVRTGGLGLGLILLIWGAWAISDNSSPQSQAQTLFTQDSSAQQAKIDTSSGSKFPIPEMVLIQGGEFEMGSNEGKNNEKPVHLVKLNDFWIGKYEVTQKEWQAVMGDNPSNFDCEDCPVESVSWNKVQEYIRKLNELGEGNFRLPTEAEWEYAARGGEDFLFSGSNDQNAVAWFHENSDSKTHPVGQKVPNAYGLLDMSGNVYEWCQDWYQSDYYTELAQKGFTVNPSGPTSSGVRVLRGGSWPGLAEFCRVSYRNRAQPVGHFSSVGFRLARTP